MTDHRTRLAAREPMTVEEEAEDLLRRQRAGLIRQVDVGPCAWCEGDGQEGRASRREAWDRGACLDCNGTGRRYRSGLELAAYCGHEAARLALGHGAGRYALSDEDAYAWWQGLHAGYGQEAVRASYLGARQPLPPEGWVNLSKPALTRWSLEEL